MRPKPAIPSVRPVKLGAVKFHHHPLAEAPFAHVTIGRNDVARHGEQQRPGKVGRRVGEHAGRVGHDDAAARGRGDVDVVVADGDVGHDLQLGALGEERVVDPVGEQRDRSRRPNARAKSAPTGYMPASATFASTIGVAREQFERLARDRPRDNDLGFAI